MGQDYQTSADMAAIAAVLQVPVKEVTETLLTAQPSHSLDKRRVGDDGNYWVKTLADPHQETPEAAVQRTDMQAQLAHVLHRLEERKQEVLRLYFGLDGEPPLTLAQVGTLLGVSRERVRQIKEKALHQLRHPSGRSGLQAWIEEL